jgi:hypothetical protein
MPGSPNTTPTQSRRGSVATAPTDASGNLVKKFHNGWTKEQETLMAEWADVAGCYRWLHDRAEKIYTGSNMWITIPVIVLSTLTGTANFAVGSFIPEGEEQLKKYVGAAIGGISIFAGILTTLGNFFQYAQKSEAHKVAGVAWGKFQRQVAVELAINPDERIEAMDFLKICRQDLDRLIEQSPPIPDAVIVAFEKEFKDIPNLKVPDICHGIEHTRVYDSSKTRLGKVAAEAALHLKYKKNALAQSILPNIDKKIEEELATRIEKRIKQLMPSPTPSPPTSPSGGVPFSAAVPLERDWRALLANRHHLLGAPTIAGHAQDMHLPNAIVESDGGGSRQDSPDHSEASSSTGEVRIHIVGDGPHIEEPSPVRTEVQFN